MTHFLVTHRDRKGNKKSVIDELYAVDYTLPLNRYGVAHIEIPTSYNFDSIFDYDRIRIERQGVIEGDTDWFIVRYGYDEDESGREFIKITAFSALFIACGPLVRYSAGTSQASASNEYSEDIIKRIMRENGGADTSVSSRTLSSDLFTVDSPTYMAPLDSKGFSNRRAVEVMREIAEKNSIYYDVVLKNTTTHQLIFKTFYPLRGADKSGLVVFSKDKGNLLQPSLMYDFTDEQTAAYAGGRGYAENRAVTSAYSARHDHMWARVMEGWCTAYEGGASSEAQAVLDKHAPIVDVAGVLADTDETQYGVHWKRGDKVTIEHKGITEDVIIENVRVAYRDSKENIRATIRGVL